MERKIDLFFMEWKNSTNKNPLVITGPTMIGKSYSVIQFGKKKYQSYIYVNLEYNPLVVNLLTKETNVDRLIEKLCLLYNIEYHQDILIVFDNVDYFDKITSILLRFKEWKTEYDVIAICNQFPIPLNNTSYIGKVTFKKMTKIDFEEYLRIFGKEELIEFIKTSYVKVKKNQFHSVALEYFKQYLMIGGYPRVIQKYIETNDYDLVLQEQHKTFHNIYSTVFKNFSGSHSKVLNVIQSVPVQLFKENKKFQYGVIKKGARQSEYLEPINWLKKNDVLVKCLRVNKINRSIASSADEEAFKLFLNDHGLLASMYGLDYKSILDKKWERQIDAILENYVANTLYNNGYQVYYYESDGKAEIPFVIQTTKGSVIPFDIERKKKAKNISRFNKDHDIEKAINLTFENFSKNGAIKNIPLYALFCIDE